METIGIMWLEEQFREDYFVVYRVRCLSYPNSIALIKVSKNRYKIFKGEYELKLGEILMVHKLAKARMDDYGHHSS